MLMSYSFGNEQINLEVLKNRAFNLRWAQVENGVIPLTAADPDFPTAPVILDAIHQFVSEGYFSYCPSEGYLFFREAISNYFFQKRNYSVSPETILPVDSAAAGIAMVCKATLEKGDEAIVFNPVDFLFKYCIENVGGVPISLEVSINPEEEIDYEKLKALISSKTKMICLCNPLNPTGKVFNQQELIKIAQIAKENQLLILSDEIWSDIVFEPHQFYSMGSINQEISEMTITVHGFSKSFGLAGLRVGCVATSNRALFKKIFAASLHDSTVHGCNALGQVAASAALTHAQPWLNDFVRHLQKMRDFCISQIEEMPNISCYTPQGCYLLFCNISGNGLSSTDLQQKMLINAKVAVVPGLPKWFGTAAEGYIRICFSTSEEVLKEAFHRMKPFFQNLQKISK